MRYFCEALVVLVGIAIFSSQASAEEMTIHNGSKVAFEYTLTVDGKVFDSSIDRGPLEYTQGDGKLIPGLTGKLEGMKAGEEKTVEVAPQDGYGMPDPAAIKTVPLSTFPVGMDIKPGMMLQGQNSLGQTIPAKVVEVKKDSIVVDLNHPLAGKTLTFKVKIVSVK